MSRKFSLADEVVSLAWEYVGGFESFYRRLDDRIHRSADSLHPLLRKEKDVPHYLDDALSSASSIDSVARKLGMDPWDSADIQIPEQDISFWQVVSVLSNRLPHELISDKLKETYDCEHSGYLALKLGHN